MTAQIQGPSGPSVDLESTPATNGAPGGNRETSDRPFDWPADALERILAEVDALEIEP